jgi:hypothetical protein
MFDSHQGYSIGHLRLEEVLLAYEPTLLMKHELGGTVAKPMVFARSMRIMSIYKTSAVSRSRAYAPREE